MRSSIVDFLDISRIDIGPQLAALRHLHDKADAINGTAELKARVREAILADEALFQAEQHWKARRRHAKHGDKAVIIDRRLNKLIAGIAGVLHAQQNLAFADPDRADRCQAMANTLFPNGIGAVTQLRYADQSQAIHLLLKHIDANPDFQALARELHFAESIESLRELNADYARQIGAHHPMDFNKIKAERRQSRERLGGIIARVFGLFPDETEEHREARRQLLEPLERQDRLQRAENRRYRPKNQDHDAALNDDELDDEASAA